MISNIEMEMKRFMNYELQFMNPSFETLERIEISIIDALTTTNKSDALVIGLTKMIFQVFIES